MITENIVELNDNNFDAEVIEANIPVLVDFWAPWCGPCKMLSPTIDSIAKEYDGRVKVCKMNTDENGTIPFKFNIRSLPTLMFFKNGRFIDQVVGSLPKGKIVQRLDAMTQQ